MKNLNLNPALNIGGHRISVDDLNVLQSSTNDLAAIVSQLLGAVPSGGLIVAGCDAVVNTGTNFGINAGWLYYNGAMWRVLPVASTAITPPSTGALYFKLNKAPIGTTVVYQSGAQFQVHVENQATLEWHPSAPSGGNYIPFNLVSFYNIQKAFEPLGAPWVAVPNAELTTYINTDNTPTKLDTANSFYRYKRLGKTLMLQVRVALNNPCNNVKILFSAANSPAQSENPTVWGYDDYTLNNPQAFVFNSSPLPNYEAARVDGTLSPQIDFQTIIETV